MKAAKWMAGRQRPKSLPYGRSSRNTVYAVLRTAYLISLLANILYVRCAQTHHLRAPPTTPSVRVNRTVNGIRRRQTEKEWNFVIKLSPQVGCCNVNKNLFKFNIFMFVPGFSLAALAVSPFSDVLQLHGAWLLHSQIQLQIYCVWFIKHDDLCKLVYRKEETTSQISCLLKYSSNFPPLVKHDYR